MTSELLPAADRLYTTEAERLNQDYRTGRATWTLVTFVAAGAAALILLLLTQWYVTRISRRILNVPLVVATVAVVGVSVWGIVALVSAQNALQTAQQKGSDSVEALSAATVLLARAQGDLSLVLVNRGTDTVDPLDFTAVIGALARPGGLIAEVSTLAQRTGTITAAQRFRDEYAAYQAKARQISRLENGGQLTTAIALAPQTSNISQQMSHDLAQQIDAAQGRSRGLPPTRPLRSTGWRSRSR